MIIGLDVGGTHTDAVLLGAEGIINDVKVPTDPENLFETVISALDLLTGSYNTAEIKRLVLSTTLATNLVVEDKLPRVAILVSCGPGRGRENVRGLEEYFVIPGALDHSGREIEPLDEDAVRAAGKRIQELGIPFVGVVSKFSIRNHEHELRMAEILAPFCERVFMGHMFSGSLSFPRRISTTYLNTAVFPVHRKFFEAVQKSLAFKGLSVPLRILKPDGGNMNLDASLDYPGLTVLSGPSASVMGAIAHAPVDKSCLVLDIGGTTTDMAIILDGAPVIAPQGIEIGRYKTLIRALMTKSIGIGGDSVIRVLDGKLRIGPDRAGVAMAYGGPQPTTTDAICFLGMKKSGDRLLAEKALAPIAQALDMDIPAAAAQIFELACKKILEAAGDLVDQINSRPVYTVHEMYEGLRVKPNHILLLGGPANHFASGLQKLFDGQVDIVPRWQVANAIGCALARTTCEVTVYADTARQIVTAQGEEYHETLPTRFDIGNVRDIAFELVRRKAIRRGANPEFLKMEIIEESSFNMIRGFSTIGKNIRVRAQVKPGLIHGYDPQTEKLDRADL